MTGSSTAIENGTSSAALDRSDGAPELSIVVTMYNEEKVIDAFFERLIPAVEKASDHYEIVCVNDGSDDTTLDCLIANARQNPAVKIVDLSRNFGKDHALSAAIINASGRAVIPIDADLQDPPELIGEMVAKWREGFDVVYGTRISRKGDTLLKRFTATAFYWVINGLSEVKIPANTGDFRLMDRRVVEVINCFPERVRFLKGLFAWVGFRQTALSFDRQNRYEGRGKWGYFRLWNYALDGITSFSSTPLKIWGYFGFVVSLFAFLVGVFFIIRTLVFGVVTPGYASLMVVILFLGGIQLISLGVIGEYVARIFSEVKGRPLFVVRQRFGFDEQKEDKE